MKLNRLMGFTPSKEFEPIPTGFINLDAVITGLPVGQLSIVGARPGLGRTAFAISLLRNIGVLHKVPSAFLSLQHTEQEVLSRLKASLDGCHDREIVASEEPEEKKSVPQWMKEAPVWIEHAPAMTLNEIISRMERLSQENNVRVFFIDSLQWLIVSDDYAEQSNGLLLLYEAAHRLQAAVVLTTNMNRSVETRNGFKRPMLIDLPDKDLKKMDTFASLVMFIYRPEYYMIEIFEDGSPSWGSADVMVCKNANGRCGNARLQFQGYYVCFNNFSKPCTLPQDSDDIMPF